MYYNHIMLLLLAAAINIAFGSPVDEYTSNNENELYEPTSNTTTSGPATTISSTTSIVSANHSTTIKPTVLIIKTSFLEAQTIETTNINAVTTTSKPAITKPNPPSSSPPDVPKLFTNKSPSQGDKHSATASDSLEPSQSTATTKSWLDSLHGPSFMIGIIATVCIIGFYKFYKIQNERSFRTL